MWSTLMAVNFFVFINVYFYVKRCRLNKSEKEIELEINQKDEFRCFRTGTAKNQLRINSELPKRLTRNPPY